MFIKQQVQLIDFAAVQADRVKGKLSDEQGEIASWMIVLAFLVVAAVYARDEIEPKLKGAVNGVRDSFK